MLPFDVMCIDVTYYHFSNVLYSAVILAFLKTILYLFKMCYKYIKPEPTLFYHSRRHILAWILWSASIGIQFFVVTWEDLTYPMSLISNIIYPACGTAPTPIQLTGYYL